MQLVHIIVIDASTAFVIIQLRPSATSTAAVIIRLDLSHAAAAAVIVRIDLIAAPRKFSADISIRFEGNECIIIVEEDQPLGHSRCFEAKRKRKEHKESGRKDRTSTRSP